MHVLDPFGLVLMRALSVTALGSNGLLHCDFSALRRSKFRNVLGSATFFAVLIEDKN